MSNPTTPATVEWTAAEREAVREAAWRFHSDGTPPARRDAILAALAPFVAERQRQAAARAYNDGYNDAVTMARCYGHTDHWPESDEPRNPYRIEQEGQP